MVFIVTSINYAAVRYESGFWEQTKHLLSRVKCSLHNDGRYFIQTVNSLQDIHICCKIAILSFHKNYSFYITGKPHVDYKVTRKPNIVEYVYMVTPTNI
jgi:hypothetical protein